MIQEGLGIIWNNNWASRIIFVPKLYDKTYYWNFLLDFVSSWKDWALVKILTEHKQKLFRFQTISFHLTMVTQSPVTTDIFNRSPQWKQVITSHNSTQKTKISLDSLQRFRWLLNSAIWFDMRTNPNENGSRRYYLYLMISTQKI